MSISKIAMLTFGMAILASSVLISNQAYAGIEVAGLPVPINESEVFGELAKQYSLWLIPTLSAVGIGAYIIKRKF